MSYPRTIDDLTPDQLVTKPLIETCCHRPLSSCSDRGADSCLEPLICVRGQ